MPVRVVEEGGRGYWFGLVGVNRVGGGYWRVDVGWCVGGSLGGRDLGFRGGTGRRLVLGEG